MNTGVDDVVERFVTPWTMYAAVYASGWIARRTVVPARFQSALATALVAAPVVAAIVIARRTDAIELTGGRCRARNKTNGERCANSRSAGEDLCGTHQNTHGVELHATALEGAAVGADNGGTTAEGTSAGSDARADGRTTARGHEREHVSGQSHERSPANMGE